MVRLNVFNNLKIIVTGLVIVIFGLAPVSALASVAVTAEDGKYILKATPCSEADQQIAAFKALKRNLNEEFPENVVMQTGNQSSCDYDITPIIPAEMKDKCNRKRAACEGPNCWNTSLRLNKIIPGDRIVRPSEFNFWLESPLCQRVKNAADLQPGDIIAIKGNLNDLGDQIPKKEDVQVHAFVYLTPELSYSKTGPDQGFEYKIRSTEEAYSESSEPLLKTTIHGTHDLHKKCRIAPDPVPNDCKRYSWAYRCKSISRYENENAHVFPISKDLSHHRDLLQDIECKVSEKSLVGPPDNSLNELIADLESLTKQAEKAHVSAQSLFEKTIWKSLSERGHSIREQISYVEKETARLKDDRINAILKETDLFDDYVTMMNGVTYSSVVWFFKDNFVISQINKHALPKLAPIDIYRVNNEPEYLKDHLFDIQRIYLFILQQMTKYRHKLENQLQIIEYDKRWAIEEVLSQLDKRMKSLTHSFTTLRDKVYPGSHWPDPR